MEREIDRYRYRQIDVRPILACKIGSTLETFEDFLFLVQKHMEYKDLTFEEFLKKLLSQ